MVSGLLAVLPARPAAGQERLKPQTERMDNDGREVGTRAWPYTPQRHVPAPAPDWPAAGSARVTLPAAGVRAAAPARAGTMPVYVDRPAGAADTAGQPLSHVDVQLLDRATMPAGLRDGLVLRVAGPASFGAGAVRLSLDYSSFRWAYGAEWASRLRLYRLSECALTSPGKPGCHASPLHSRNDTTTGRVTAEVIVHPSDAATAPTAPTAPTAQPTGDAAGPAGPGTLVALMAGASGESGDFSATPLASSSTWSAGSNSGDFTWSYPMRVPPGIAGLTPSIAVAYSSSSVDGRSEATNNQPSWLGEGFDYWPGYIERRYVPCADDMDGDRNNTIRTGDQCWRSDNATMSLNNRGGELVFEPGKGWHARTEDGSKIEKLTGADNGDNNGEYWKVTDASGTQYFFGRHSLPGQASATNSTWTVPVAGNHSGEPCHETGFVSSFCDQAWRWNLDHVVDVRGNTISLWYAKETNKYARNFDDSDAVTYVRGGRLTRIDYGTWDRGADRSTTAIAQVVFTPADRCVTSSCGTHNATNWPDTPWDQECTGSACTGKYSPTFWSTKRLAKVTTRVWDTTKATPAWQDVESWTFTHSFPPPGDGSEHAGLWLDSIVHAGHVGGTVTLPPVTFTPISLPNRVLTDHTTTFSWQRIDYLITEAGARIDLEWKLPQCTGGNLPAAAHTNTMRCYPVMVVDPDDPQGEALVEEWWHKHVVASVSESDLPTDPTGHQAPPKFTFYEYVGTPAWHYADDDGLVIKKRKTWSQWRGYPTVETRVGDVPGAQTLTVTNYLRGMHGDRAAPAGGTRTVTVPASVGSETVHDEDQFAGMIREQVVHNGTRSRPVSKTVNVPWMSPPTASRTINGDTVTARFTNIRTVYKASALGVDGARGWRVNKTETSFDNAFGTVVWSQDSGDAAASGDEQCTTYTYNRNPAKNLLQIVKQVTETARPCGTAPATTDHVIADNRYFYDGAAALDTVPGFGSVSKVESLKDWSPAGGTVWQTTDRATFDAYGRQVTSTDIKGNTSTNTFTPASGGPVVKTTATMPAPYSWVTNTELNPYWGSTTKVTDANGRVTDVTYDPLGRVSKVWKAGWDKTGHEASPSTEYAYTYAANRDAYPYVTSRVLHAGGGYLTSYQILDSLLRPRQTQTAAINGGRVVTDTIYDKLGRADTEYAAHAEPGTASGRLWWEPEWSVPAVTKTVFDNADRPTASILLSGDGVTNLVEKWRTSTGYEGDLTKTTPPNGGTATTTVTDIRGRTVELRQHTTASGVTGPYDATSYTYNGKDQLAKVTDPARNEWTYTFDVKGRQISSTDPDTGTITSVYNDFNELVTTTDARGEVLWYGYDQLSRKTQLRDDSATGALRAQWKYDLLSTGQTVRGQLTESHRYEPAGSANVYKWQALGFTARYQPTSVNYVIPAVEGNGLAGTHIYTYGYSPYDGSPADIGYPAGGGLAGETVTTRFDATTGLPSELETNAINVGNYVALQQYTAFGEPTLTMRKIAGGVYVEDTTHYDEATRRITRTRTKPETATGTVSDRTYTYTDAGGITAIADAPQLGPADRQCFRQDPLGRLITAWTPQTGDCQTNPSVANLGGPAPYWLDWEIDRVGNRTEQTSHATAGDTVTTYTVPAGGPGVVRPHAVTGSSTTAPGQPAVLTGYGYDKAGNTTCRPSGTATNTCPQGGNSQTLTWDAEGKLSTVAAGSTLETNVYSTEGSRWIRRDATGTTLYLPGQELHRAPGGAVTGTRYYTFAGRTIGSRTPAGLTWLHADHQGTQQVAVDAGTQAITIRRQQPYGAPRGSNPHWPNQKGFVGGTQDPTGLTKIGVRHYDPGLGRFVSADPILDFADPQAWNPYAYAGNSPITYSDPSGMTRCDLWPGACQSGAIPTDNGPPRGGGGGGGGGGTSDNSETNYNGDGNEGSISGTVDVSYHGGNRVTVVRNEFGATVATYINDYLLPYNPEDPYTLAEWGYEHVSEFGDVTDPFQRLILSLAAACESGRAGCETRESAALKADLQYYIKSKDPNCDADCLAWEAFIVTAYATGVAAAMTAASVRLGGARPYAVRGGPAMTRNPRDVAVHGTPAPKRLSTNRSIGRPSHNQALQADIAQLPPGASNIRVNQQQVNAAGVRVGINRPDLQYTLNGRRYYVEYEGLSNPRGAAHQARIMANDPNAVFILRIVP